MLIIPAVLRISHQVRFITITCCTITTRLCLDIMYSQHCEYSLVALVQQHSLVFI